MRQDAFCETLGVTLEDVAPVGVFKCWVLEILVQILERPHNVLTGFFLLTPCFAEQFVLLRVVLQAVTLTPERFLALEGEVESGFERGQRLLSGLAGRGR